jgi:hypothetical protein
LKVVGRQALDTLLTGDSSKFLTHRINQFEAGVNEGNFDSGYDEEQK